MPDIPHLIHFIWVGGVIPTTHLANIERWRLMNPNYQVWLWYDSRNMLANSLRKKVVKAGLHHPREGPAFERMQASRGTFGTDAGRLDDLVALSARNANPAGPVKDRAYYEEKGDRKLLAFVQKCMLKQIVVKDLRGELGQCSNGAIYDLELGNSYPNFGAASDVMRYELLIRHGGIYLDIDIECIRTLPAFQVREDLARFGIWEPYGMSSACMGACPESDFLKRCRSTIRTNYMQLSVDRELQAYYRGDMRSWGINKTGPTVASSNLRTIEDERVAARGHTVAAFQEAAAWISTECHFPPGYFNFETEAQKEHKWLPAAAAAAAGPGH